MSYRMLSKTKLRFGSSASKSISFPGLSLPSDDFTGTNGSALNSTLWAPSATLHGTASYSALIQSNKNHMQFTGDHPAFSDGVIVTSLFQLIGDFEVQIEFSDLVTVNHNAAGYTFGVMMPDLDDAATVKAHYFAGVKWLMRHTRGGSVFDQHENRTNDFGTMLISRVGSSTFVSFVDGSGDVISGGNQQSSMSTGPATVIMEGYDWDSGASIEVDFDNFVVNSADGVTWS